MLKSVEMIKTLKNMIKEAKDLTGEDKAEKLKEIKNFKKELEAQQEIEAVENSLDDEGTEGADGGDEGEKSQPKNKVSILHAMAKSVMGRNLTQEESQSLVNAVKNNVNGEEHIQIKELSTRIRELLRHEKSLKRLITVHKTVAATGQFPINNSVASDLVEVVDGVPMVENQDLDFGIIKYTIKKWGNLGALTDTTLKYSTADLMEYLAKLFVKAYIRKVNTDIVDRVLKNYNATTEKWEYKEAKGITSIKDVVSETRLGLDAALQPDAVVLMSPECFNQLTKEEDGKKISYVQPDLTKPAIPYINGHLIEFVYTGFGEYNDGTNDVYPIAYANMSELIMMFENEEYSISMSKEAGWLRNVVLSKIICYFDMQVVDDEAVSVLKITKA